MTEVEAAVADAHRREWARVLAATVRVARDLDLAEECVQEAYASAMKAWDRPASPTTRRAWLTTAAKRRATDRCPVRQTAGSVAVTGRGAEPHRATGDGLRT